VIDLKPRLGGYPGRKEVINMTAGQNIKAARERAGISQTELAERIGTTRQQIGKYETGTQDMTVERMLRIAAALGVEPVTLVK
jgi:transcriptional regulator with XRE-family HTH domain